MSGTTIDQSERQRDAIAATAAPRATAHRASRRQRWRLLLWLLADLVVVAVALWSAYLARFDLQLGARVQAPTAPPTQYVKLYWLLTVTIVALCRGQGLFRLDSVRSRIEEAVGVTKATTFATVFVLALTFFYRDFSYSRATLLFFWLQATIGLTLVHIGFRTWQVRDYARGIGRRRAVVIGQVPSYVVDRLVHDPAFGLEVVGTIDLARVGGEPAEATRRWGGDDDQGPRVGALMPSATARRTKASQQLPSLGALDRLGSALEQHAIEQLVVVEHDLPHHVLLEILDACEQREVQVRLIPPVYDLLVQPEDLAYVRDVPLLRVDESRYRRSSRLIKRVFDVTASAVLLVVLTPLLLVVAWLIRRGSPGPALFVQVRAGERGRPFRMYKFRTMVVDAEQRLAEIVDVARLEQPMFKIASDPRVTPIGRWLRRTSFDELPQLWNVLKGDMSLVGPRPEELRVVDRYDVWQRRRLKVKPGITGLQQVEARGGLSDLNERVRLDVYYIRKQSLLLDLAILARTVGVVVAGRGAT